MRVSATFVTPSSRSIFPAALRTPSRRVCHGRPSGRPPPARCPVRTRASFQGELASPDLAQAVKHSESGNFALAAASLAANQSALSALDPVARSALVQSLLNPITLARVAAAGENVEQFDGGVRALYRAMSSAGLLSAFGSARTAGRPDDLKERFMTVEKLVSASGLPLAALSPKRASLLKWNVAGIAVVTAIAAAARSLGGETLAVPAIGVIGALLAIDQSLLRGTVFEAVSTVVAPKVRERMQATVATHEAGHFLIAYLQGLQISGYVLSGNDARKAKIPSSGQGGTLFLFPDLQKELGSGTLKAATIDVWSTVLMAGIAAEAMTFGQAKGGASDEATLVALLNQLRWEAGRVKAQARYGVLSSVLLLQENREAHAALVDKLLERAPLGECIDLLERLACVRRQVAAPSAKAPLPSSTEIVTERERIARREAQVEAELDRLKERMDELDRQG